MVHPRSWMRFSAPLNLIYLCNQGLPQPEGDDELRWCSCNESHESHMFTSCLQCGMTEFPRRGHEGETIYSSS